MESLLLDVRYAWRALRKSPRFAAVAILTLAIGIGASVTFPAVNPVLLRPLRIAQSDQLVDLYACNATRGGTPMISLRYQ